MTLITVHVSWTSCENYLLVTSSPFHRYNAQQDFGHCIFQTYVVFVVKTAICLPTLSNSGRGHVLFFYYLLLIWLAEYFLHFRYRASPYFLESTPSGYGTPAVLSPPSLLSIVFGICSGRGVGTNTQWIWRSFYIYKYFSVDTWRFQSIWWENSYSS